MPVAMHPKLTNPSMTFIVSVINCFCKRFKPPPSGGYPDKVFRELLVNAVVHLGYSIIGSQIKIFMFNDRIEFISPGRLPNTVTIAYWLDKRSDPVFYRWS